MKAKEEITVLLGLAFCVLGVSSNLTRSVMLKFFSARELFYLQKFLVMQNFNSINIEKVTFPVAHVAIQIILSFWCLKKQTKWNRYEDRNSIMLS